MTGHPRPHIVIDPAMCFGAPQIRGVSTEAIASMVRAGEDFSTVADEYDLTLHEVILACWWEAQPAPWYRREWRAWADSVAPALGGWEPLDVEAIAEPPAKAAAGCPPGLAKKGCMPPGQAKKYAIGQPLAAEYRCLDDWSHYNLARPRDGYCYSRVDNDIVLIARATRNVIELVKIIDILTH